MAPEVLSKFMPTSDAATTELCLRAAYTTFPISYAEFRRWCSTKKVPVPILYELERIAIASNYITMPETSLVIFSEKEMFVNETKDKSVVQEKPVDPAQEEDEKKLADGTVLKRVKE